MDKESIGIIAMSGELLTLEVGRITKELKERSIICKLTPKQMSSLMKTEKT
jgi:hypothetical protein